MLSYHWIPLPGPLPLAKKWVDPCLRVSDFRLVRHVYVICVRSSWQKTNTVTRNQSNIINLQHRQTELLLERLSAPVHHRPSPIGAGHGKGSSHQSVSCFRWVTCSSHQPAWPLTGWSPEAREATNSWSPSAFLTTYLCWLGSSVTAGPSDRAAD